MGHCGAGLPPPPPPKGTVKQGSSTALLPPGYSRMGGWLYLAASNLQQDRSLYFQLSEYTVHKVLSFILQNPNTMNNNIMKLRS